jgi:outer membrane biosynthesis protein TonB
MRSAALVSSLGHVLVAILIIELTHLGQVPPPPEPMDVQMVKPPLPDLQTATTAAVVPVAVAAQATQAAAAPPPPPSDAPPPPLQPPPPPITPPPPPSDMLAAADPILPPPPPLPPEVQPIVQRPPPTRRPPPPRVTAARTQAKPVEQPAQPAEQQMAAARVPSPAAAAATGPSDSEVVRVGSSKPIYPSSMVAQEREGSADAVCLVLPSGDAGECRLLSVQGGSAFGPAVLTFLKNQRYHPAIRGGQPVESEFRYHFDFKLVD